MTQVLSVDARTGVATPTAYSETEPPDLDLVAARASSAVAWLEQLGRVGRRELLYRLAENLGAHEETIVATADRETALGDTRLRGELARTCDQLRFQGDVVLEGSYLDATIDHATETPAGRRPDLRSSAVAVGPVAVFGPNNFPLAFGVAGGDSASALAAGCPVIAKAHPSAVETSGLVATIVSESLAQVGAPEGVFAVVYGNSAGVTLVQHPAVKAVGFTGSLAGGRFLAGVAHARPFPVPFFGELGSVNPVVVSSAAAAELAQAIGEGLAASMTLSMGQFCTKPGFLLIPTGDDGDVVVETMVSTLQGLKPGYLLNDATLHGYETDMAQLSVDDQVEILGSLGAPDRQVRPVLAQVTASSLTSNPNPLLLNEHFGPFALVVRWAGLRQLRDVLELLPPALTGTMHVTDTDDDTDQLAELLRHRSGRVVVNGYPTGVAVTWAMQHGGPFPASTGAFTSVGGGAIRRWVRPLCWQDATMSILPDELHDSPTVAIPRRVDGLLHEQGRA